MEPHRLVPLIRCPLDPAEEVEEGEVMGEIGGRWGSVGAGGGGGFGVSQTQPGWGEKAVRDGDQAWGGGQDFWRVVGILWPVATWDDLMDKVDQSKV